VTGIPFRANQLYGSFLLIVLSPLIGISTVLGAIDYFEVTPGAAGVKPASTTITVYQGSTVTIRVNGHGTDLAQSVTVSGRDVQVLITGRKNGFQHKHYRTKLPLGELSIRVSAQSNASEGGRTVTIRYPVGQDRFYIVIKKRPAPGSVDIGARRAWVKLAAPFKAPHLFYPPIGVDHKRGSGANDLDCQSYRNLPFPTCYRKHTGTDFLMSGGFLRMDLGSTEVLAAAPGEVWKIENGQFDRCFGDPIKMGINCNRQDDKTPANYVIIKQDDELYAGYYHLQNGSVPSFLKKGTRVKCGDVLGRVGSSGKSAYPHLHFHLSRDSNHDNTATDRFIDPYKERLWLSVTRSGVPNGKCPLR
jgi:murein DD-endopeptidase MepM/ murein hydrolase activator NlpD